MNLKEIKDAARQAFRDQQSQDTEGGVPDGISFIAGFVAGARHAQEVLDRADLIQTNREDVLPAAQEAAHYTWLDDTVDKLKEENKKLVEALKFYANSLNYSAIVDYKGLHYVSVIGEKHELGEDNGRLARQVLKEIGEE